MCATILQDERGAPGRARRGSRSRSDAALLAAAVAGWSGTAGHCDPALASSRTHANASPDSASTAPRTLTLSGQRSRPSSTSAATSTSASGPAAPAPAPRRCAPHVLTDSIKEDCRGKLILDTAQCPPPLPPPHHPRTAAARPPSLARQVGLDLEAFREEPHRAGAPRAPSESCCAAAARATQSQLAAPSPARRARAARHLQHRRTSLRPDPVSEAASGSPTTPPTATTSRSASRQCTATGPDGCCGPRAMGHGFMARSSLSKLSTSCTPTATTPSTWRSDRAREARRTPG